MPEYTALAKIPSPLWDEPDQVPVDMKAVNETIDPLLVLRATNKSDAASRYPNAPAGTIVTATDTNAVYRKNLAGGWDTIWSNNGWKTVTLTGGWANVAANNPLQYLLLGQQVYWRGSLNPPDDLAKDTWVKIASVPAEAQSTWSGQRFPVAMASDDTVYMCRVYGSDLEGWFSGTRVTPINWFAINMSYAVV